MIIDTLLGHLTGTPITSAHADTIGKYASAVSFLSVSPLVWRTLTRKARPAPVTWLVWFLVGSVATIAMALGGAPLSAWWLKGALSLGPLLVVIAAVIRKRPWRADVWDKAGLYVGLAGTLVYVAAYFAFNADPDTAMIAVGTAVAVDCIGALPTWRDCARDPWGQIVTTFWIALGSVITVLLILPLPWTWLSSSYLCFLVVQMLSIIGDIHISRRRVPRPIPQQPQPAVLVRRPV